MKQKQSILQSKSTALNPPRCHVQNKPSWNIVPCMHLRLRHSHWNHSTGKVRSRTVTRSTAELKSQNGHYIRRPRNVSPNAPSLGDLQVLYAIRHRFHLGHAAPEHLAVFHGDTLQALRLLQLCQILYALVDLLLNHRLYEARVVIVVLRARPVPTTINTITTCPKRDNTNGTCAAPPSSGACKVCSGHAAAKVGHGTPPKRCSRSGCWLWACWGTAWDGSFPPGTPGGSSSSWRASPVHVTHRPNCKTRAEVAKAVNCWNLTFERGWML